MRAEYENVAEYETLTTRCDPRNGKIVTDKKEIKYGSQQEVKYAKSSFPCFMILINCVFFTSIETLKGLNLN